MRRRRPSLCSSGLLLAWMTSGLLASGLMAQAAESPEPRFSGQAESRLRVGFYGTITQRQRMIPNSVRDALYRQRRRHLAQTFSVSPGESLTPSLRAAMVPLPASTYRALQLADRPSNTAVGIVGRHVVLFDTHSGKIYDVLQDFLVR